MEFCATVLFGITRNSRELNADCGGSSEARKQQNSGAIPILLVLAVLEGSTEHCGTWSLSPRKRKIYRRMPFWREYGKKKKQTKNEN